MRTSISLHVVIELLLKRTEFRGKRSPSDVPVDAVGWPRSRSRAIAIVRVRAPENSKAASIWSGACLPRNAQVAYSYLESIDVSKAYVFRNYGGPETEALIDRPVPAPGPGQLLVAMHAASTLARLKTLESDSVISKLSFGSGRRY